jgi:hypothetical protein
MDAAQRFQSETEHLLSRPSVTRSTMMGFPCVCVEGKFFASFDEKTGHLLVKLPEGRVDQIIEQGDGIAFSPAGRRFREWVGIPLNDHPRWPAMLSEALEFVTT